MKTEKLFVKDVYLKEADLLLQAMDASKLGSESILRLAFESTLFFPLGGGQLCDEGYIDNYRVFDVAEEKETGIIWHSIMVPNEKQEDAKAYFCVGEVYPAKLDWDVRFRHMQMHCGEHILSGAFGKLFGGENKGFHMGEDYVTIDISCPCGELSHEQIAMAELAANKVVWADLPVKTYYFDTIDEALSLPLRKKVKAEEDISVVCVGEGAEMADCCACCGTHPSSSGQIGIIKIVHHEKYKGMNRFYVKFGEKALLDYSMKHDFLSALGRRFSCEPLELDKAIDAAEVRNQEVYKEYCDFKSEVLKTEEEKLAEKLAEQSSPAIYSFEKLKADDLQNLVSKFGGKINNLCAFLSEKDKVCILASGGDPACGNLVKENVQRFNGKGGGKPNLARANFVSFHDAKAFAESVCGGVVVK